MQDLVIAIKGAGEMASAIAHCLFRANFLRTFMMETASPLAIRRRVSFSSAIHSKEITIEGVNGIRAENISDMQSAWTHRAIPIVADPRWLMIKQLRPKVVIDAIVAKKNLGTAAEDAELVVALGPGFVAGQDAHVVIETNRGHNLGRLIFSGPADKDTGIPGVLGGYSSERVLRAPIAGRFVAKRHIGDRVQPNECVGMVGDQSVRAEIAGVLRGIIRNGTTVQRGLKIGDIDPRGQIEFCYTISDKARAIAGAVLTSIMMQFNRSNCRTQDETDKYIQANFQCA